MTLARGRGRITFGSGKAIVSARCPLCGGEHRYEKGDANGEEIEAIRARGFTDEWLPCQGDLPGNFWRIVVAGNRQSAKPGTQRRGRGSSVA